MSAPTSISFFQPEVVLELAKLISTLKKEAEDVQPYYVSIKLLYDQAHFPEIFSSFAKESKILLDVSEKDFESTYNLLIALIKDATADVFPTLVHNIITPIVESGPEKGPLKLKVLSNLYNNINANSPCRFDVYIAIIKVAAKAEEIESLLPHLTSIDRWVREWGINVEQQRTLFLVLSEALKGANFSRESYEQLLKHLATYNSTPKTLPQSKAMTLRAIHEAISNPEVLNFEDLFNLKAVQALAMDKIFAFLKIFLSENLQEYRKFVKANPKFVQEQNLSEESNVRKIRLLSMASLAAQHSPGEISYDAIAKALEIPQEDVEFWVIDVIRAGLLVAKINQFTKSVIVTRSTHRVFSQVQWKQLSKKIAVWRQGLDEVLTVLANSKQLASGGLTNLQSTANNSNSLTSGPSSK